MGDSMNASSTGDSLLEESVRAAEQARELQDAAAALMSRTWADEQSLRQRTLAIDSDLKRLESVSKKNRSLDPKLKEKIEEELYRARCILTDGDTAALLPSKAHGSIYLLLIPFLECFFCCVLMYLCIYFFFGGYIRPISEDVPWSHQCAGDTQGGAT
jgi:hypothetical protein